MQIHHLDTSQTSTTASGPLMFASAPDDDSSLAAIIAAAFDGLNIPERAQMLGRLLSSVGPLGLAVIGGGAFAKYVTQSRLPEVPVSDEDAAHATPCQLSELVRYVEQSDPQSISRLLDMIGFNSASPGALDSRPILSTQPA